MRLLPLLLLLAACRPDAAVVSADGGVYCIDGDLACLTAECPHGYDIVARRAGDICVQPVVVVRCKP